MRTFKTITSQNYRYYKLHTFTERVIDS